MGANKTTSRSGTAPAEADIAPADSQIIKQHLDNIRPVLQDAANGTFATHLAVPKESDEFTDIYTGIQTMLEVIRDQQEEIKSLNQMVRVRTTDHSRALEEAQALTHLGSWEWDIATDNISWSDELYRIYGMRPQEREIGFDEFISLIHPGDRQRVQDVIGEAFQSGEPFEFEHRIILPNGNERILKGMGKMVRSEEGTPIRMLGTSQDITVAKQLDRAKDEFISLVSHQLRTPLTIIRIHGGILEEGIAGALDPSQEKHIRTMTRASVRLIELVDDILSISRVTLNRIRVNAKPTDPNKLITACVDEAIPMAHAKNVKLIFLPDPNIGEVAIDLVVFGEILRNLIGNAVRYARSDKGQINVTFRRQNDEYLLSVSDNGIGIPQMDQAYIFDRFYRANNATVVDSEGSGLGLYIVKLFVEAAGGRIWFESTENVGTTFFVAFPGDGMQPTPVKSA